jgi:predicted DNA-binding mobile mystery protein A
MTTSRAQARRHLDTRLERVRSVAGEHPPHRGWIRAIRDALGMSASELAARMGVGQSTVVDIETSEAARTIKLETLHRAADALGCDVAYFLVPRSSLEETVRARARRSAAAHLRGIAHHGRLEDQTVDDDATRAQLEELAERLVDRRGLWSSAEE